MENSTPEHKHDTNDTTEQADTDWHGEEIMTGFYPFEDMGPPEIARKKPSQTKKHAA